MADMKIALLLIPLCGLLFAQDGKQGDEKKGQDNRDKPIIRPVGEITAEIDSLAKTSKCYSAKVYVTRLVEGMPIQRYATVWVYVEPKTLERRLYMEEFEKSGVDPADEKTTLKSRVLFVKNEIIITDEESKQYTRYDATRPLPAALPAMFFRDSLRKEVRDHFDVTCLTDPKLQKITADAADLQHFHKDDPVNVEDTRMSAWCKKCDRTLTTEQIDQNKKCTKCGTAVEQISVGEFQKKLDNQSREKYKPVTGDLVFVYAFEVRPTNKSSLYGKLRECYLQFRYPKLMPQIIRIVTEDSESNFRTDEVNTEISETEALDKMKLDVTDYKYVEPK